MMAVARALAIQRRRQLMRSSNSQSKDWRRYLCGRSYYYNILDLRSIRGLPLGLLTKQGKYGMRPTVMDYRSLTLIMRLRITRSVKRIYIVTRIFRITQRA